MTLIGLTGGVGMGKSSAATLLEQRGIPVVDTDTLARELVEPGQPALAWVEEMFGEEVIGTDGRLRRERLAEIVFSNPERRRKLEAILHPRIRERWLALAAGWRSASRPLGVVVIPLLFETEAAQEFDRVVCVACSPESQRARLRSRGWSDQEIDLRLAAQWPTQRKMDRAHHVIWTEPSLEVHGEQWDMILRGLRTPTQ